MKKRFMGAVLFACLFSVQAHAQQLKFGVEAGANWSHYKNYKGWAEQVGGMGAGFQIAATVEYESEHHWMLMSGLTFMQTRSRMMLYNSSMPFFPNTEIRLNHLEIPLKVGYNIHISKGFCLIPFVGMYGTLNFNAGKSKVKELLSEKANRWKPMDGYSYILPEGYFPYECTATIDPFRRWTYGGLGGVKAVVADRYTLSFQYHESIMKVQKQCNLRNYGYRFNVGYRF